MAVKSSLARIAEASKRINREVRRFRKKNPGIPLYPLSVEAEYRKALLYRLRYARALVVQMLTPRIGDVRSSFEESRATVTQDSAADDVKKALNNIRTLTGIRFTIGSADSLALEVGEAAQAFNLVQAKAAYKRVVGINPVIDEPYLQDQLQSFAYLNAQLITSIPEKYLDDVGQRVFAGLTEGTLTRDIFAGMTEAYGISERRAAFIARDQVAKLNGQLNTLRFQNLGASRYTWMTMQDERVRDTHAENEGKVFSFDDPPEETGNPGDEINCVPGFSTVSLHAATKKAFRRRYDGELTEIISGPGEPLRITPNHPVLTQRGWIAAKLVKVGDYLIEAPREDRDTREQHPECGDSNAGQIFRSFLEGGLQHGVTLTASGFHGDAIDQYVDVVLVDRSLEFADISCGPQITGELNLSEADPAGPALGSDPQLLRGPLDSANGGMGIAGQLKPLLRGQPSHAEVIGLASTANPDTGAEQDSANRNAAYLHAISDAKLAHAVKVKPDDFIFRKVESVVGMLFRGYVHNFETSTGWYTSANRIVHNCRCIAAPIFDDEEGSNPDAEANAE